MPLYEYRCDDCDLRFEMLQPLGAGAEGVHCPQCESPQVEKQFSTFAAAGSGESVGEPCGSPGCPRASGFS